MTLMPLLEEHRIRFLWSVAGLWLRVKRPERAARVYERILRIRPDDRQAVFQRAWSLIDIPHRRNEAIAALRDLLDHSPPYPFGLFLMGSALQIEGRHQEAVAAFEKAERGKRPGPPEFYFNWGKSLIALGRREDAAEAFRQAALLNPSDVESWRILGGILVELRRWQDGAACQERVMRLAPCVLHGLELGETLYELNRLDEAEQVVRQVLALEPRSANATGLLAQIVTEQGRHEEGVHLARRIRTADPAALEPRVVLAGVLSLTGKKDEALQEANAAVDIAPGDPRAHYALGNVCVVMNDGHAALLAFDRMAECMDRDSDRIPSLWREWCCAGRGAALSLVGRHAEAMAAFTEALTVDPQFFARCRTFAPYYERSSREMP
jgi:tetratricopeptide (TPR) repeat protein